MTEAKIKLESKLAYIGAGVILGVFVLAGVLMLAFMQNTQSVGPPLNPLKGVFYGQVVDALTLDPIANATVHLCNGKSLDDLVTTVTTNASGYYGTTNITLSEAGGTFYVSAESPGYYTEPLGRSTADFSGYETASEINASVYSISPIKLFRISNDARMVVEILPPAGMVIADKSDNYTYQLINSTRVDFNVIMWNHQIGSAAGSPYYGNRLQVIANDSTAIMYPTDSINEESLIYGNFQWNPMHIEHFSITFVREGLTQITLMLKEGPYPSFYNCRQYLSLSFTFWVNVTWS